MSFTRLRPLLIGLSVLLTLVFVVWTVGRNEQTIANGRDAFVELRPVDPLSLVQGYYMALNMQVDLPPRDDLGIADVRAVFSLDDRGVATASRWLDVGDGANRPRVMRIGRPQRRRSHPPGREGRSASVRQAGQLSVRGRAGRDLRGCALRSFPGACRWSLGADRPDRRRSATAGPDQAPDRSGDLNNPLTETRRRRQIKPGQDQRDHPVLCQQSKPGLCQRSKPGQSQQQHTSAYTHRV